MKITSGTDSLKADGRTVIGIQLRAYGWHTTANTAFAALPFDWTKLSLDIKYKWGQQEVRILKGKMKAYLMANAFNRGEFKMCSQLGTEYIPVLLAATGGVDETVLVSVNFLFHNPINCTKGRSLEMDISLMSEFYAATIDQASSYLEVDWIEGDGHDPYIPAYKETSINAGETDREYPIGNDVIDLVFVNDDKAGILAADRVLDTVSVSTASRKGIQKSYYQMLAERQAEFVDPADADFRSQTFRLLNANGMRHKGVTASLGFVSANVNSGKNVLISAHSITSKAMVDLYHQVENEHRKENAI